MPAASSRTVAVVLTGVLLAVAAAAGGPPPPAQAAAGVELEATLRAASLPKLAAFLERARLDPASVAADLRASPLAAIAEPVGPSAAPRAEAGALPIVVAHGMGKAIILLLV
eukprot:SAG22_NODE_1057_length_5776_cov_5.548529_4_plen_112_part_00